MAQENKMKQNMKVKVENSKIEIGKYKIDKIKNKKQKIKNPEIYAKENPEEIQKI